MKIRKFTKKDFKEVYEIMRKEFSKKPYNEKWTWKNGLKVLNYYLKLDKKYVAILDNKIVGYVIAFKEPSNEGMILIVEDLAVDSKYHGQCIGKKLMKKIESDCKKSKIKSISLTTHKKGAFEFYKKIGYKYNKNRAYFGKKLN